MSTAPSPYERQANFTSFEANNPTTPKPGSSLDAEFNAIRTLANALLSRLAEIQRDDGRLLNGVVSSDALSAEALTLIGSDITPRGDWVPGVVYNVRDLVAQAGINYIARTQHVSGSNFSADLVGGRWQGLTSASTAASVPYTPAGGLLSSNVQAAITELAGLVAARQPLNTTLSQLAALSRTPNSLPFFSPTSGDFALAAFTTIGRILAGATNSDTIRNAAGITTGDAAFDYVQLDGSARLPSVDASQLFNLTIPANYIGATQLADTLNLSGKTITLPAALTPAFTRSFVSSELTITNGGGSSVAHGLGQAPKIVQIRLVCKTAELGYSINDEVVFGTLFQGFDRGVAVFPDATNIGYRYANQANVFSYANKSTGAINALTNSNWRMVIRAYA